MHSCFSCIACINLIYLLPVLPDLQEIQKKHLYIDTGNTKCSAMNEGDPLQGQIVLSIQIIGGNY